jgi:hypothetical protein
VSTAWSTRWTRTAEKLENSRSVECSQSA